MSWLRKGIARVLICAAACDPAIVVVSPRPAQVARAPLPAIAHAPVIVNTSGALTTVPHVALYAPVPQVAVRLRLAVPLTSEGECDAANVAGGATNCPLLTQEQIMGDGGVDFTNDWDGGFCLPDTPNPTGGTYVDFAPNGSIGFDPSDDTLWIGSGVDDFNRKGLAHLTIPALVQSGSTNSLNRAGYVTSMPIIEPTEGRYNDSGDGVYPGDPTSSGLTALTALLPWGSNICGTFQYFYQSTVPTQPFFCRPKDLTDTGNVVGMMGFSPIIGTDAGERMFTATCGLVPTEWQTALGGTAWCGGGASYSIIATAQSLGPSLCTLDPNDILDGTGSARCLVYYPPTHPTLGAYESEGDWEGGEMYDGSTQIVGAAIISRTRTALFFGITGNSWCYGTGTSDPELVGEPDGTGSVYCLDPSNSAKANHGWPYDYRVWAVDLNDLAAVKAGTKQPWEVIPYLFFTIEFPPTLVDASPIYTSGLAYDEDENHLYFAQSQVCTGSNAAIWRRTPTIP